MVNVPPFICHKKQVLFFMLPLDLLFGIAIGIAAFIITSADIHQEKCHQIEIKNVILNVVRSLWSCFFYVCKV